MGDLMANLQVEGAQQHGQLITNLRQGACVEVPCVVTDRRGGRGDGGVVRDVELHERRSEFVGGSPTVALRGSLKLRQ